MEAKVKTMRHIETVRNYLNLCVRELLDRAEEHDQSKLESPEVEIFEEYTPKLRDCTYGSDEYNSYLKEMKVALDHHYSINRHHPEHFKNGMYDMTLIDLLEMFVDWYAAGKRHADGNIYDSIEKNAKRFGIATPMTTILYNTANWICSNNVKHKADES